MDASLSKLPIFQQAKELPLQPLMAVLGADPWARQQVRQILIKRALGPQLPEMNFAKYQVGQDPMAKVLEQCRDYPCFAERRVVLVQDVEKLKKKEAGGLVDYLRDPQPTTVLLLEGEKLDGRLEWVKVFKKQGTLLELPPFERNQAMTWVQQCFVQEGKEVEEGVVELLLETIGLNLGSLQQAVTQVCLYVGEAGVVRLGDVETLLSKVSEENVFEILEAFFSGQRRQYVQGLERLLSSGEAPLRILALLYRHVSLLLAIRWGREGEVWSLFRMPFSVRRRYEDQARRFGNRLNYALLKPLTEADAQLKGSPLSGKLILKTCVENLGRLLV